MIVEMAAPSPESRALLALTATEGAALLAPRSFRESMVSPGHTSDGVTNANIGARGSWFPTPFQPRSRQVRGGT
jgi:hypothetical protein